MVISLSLTNSQSYYSPVGAIDEQQWHTVPVHGSEAATSPLDAIDGSPEVVEDRSGVEHRGDGEEFRGAAQFGGRDKRTS